MTGFCVVMYIVLKIHDFCAECLFFIFSPRNNSEKYSTVLARVVSVDKAAFQRLAFNYSSTEK